jgi:hypothetical protein
MCLGDVRHQIAPGMLLSLYKLFRMKFNGWNKENNMKTHSHKTDETSPEIFLNVDLVRKPESKKHTPKKDCKNCCDQCRANEKKKIGNIHHFFDK